MRKCQYFYKRFFCFIFSIILLSSVFIGVNTPVKAAVVERGAEIKYSSYIPGGTWSTHYYRLDGHTAYCIESEKSMVDDGDYGTIDEVFSSYPLLCKVLFYGYDGPAYKMGEFFYSNYGITLTEEQAYLYTHIAANYAYGGFVWHGLSEETAHSLHIDDWIVYCDNNVCMPENKHLTGGIVKVATPGGAQKVAYLDSYDFEDIDVSVEVKINFDKTKNTYGDATTHNAVYGLFDSSDVELQRITLTIPPGSSAASGSLVHTFDTSGTYYVKEISAPKGYLIDNTKYYFTVDTSGQNASSTDIHFKSVNTKEITFTKSDENVVKGRFSFTKKDENGSPLSGAGFDVYLKSSVPTGGGSYDFSQATPVCARLTSGADGVVTSPNLDYGVYLVHEAAVPEGKLPIPDFEVNINSNGETVAVGDKFDDSIKGRFHFTKIDEDGKPLKGAGFDVYLKSSLSKVGGKYDFNSATPVCSGITSNADGEVVSPLIPYGTYVVHEATVPKGKLPVEDFEVIINSNETDVSVGNKTDSTIRGNFTFRKKDEDGNPLQGAGFDVYLKSAVPMSGGGYNYSASTPVCTGLISDSDGRVTSPALDYGVYLVHEAIVPEGKLPVDDFEVSIKSNGETVEIKDKIDKSINGRFYFRKTDDDGNCLEGAGFDVYLKSSLTKVDGKWNFSSASPVCQRIVSNENGIVTSPLIPYGTYVVHESAVPEGKLPVDDFEVSIETKDSYQNLGNKTDKTIRGKFTFRKTDDDSNPLAGAGFDVYLKSSLKKIDGKWDFSSAYPVGKRLISDADGIVSSDMIDYGIYIIHEAVVPEGKLPIEDFEVSITTDKVTVDVSDKKDETIRGCFTLSKAGDDGYPIEGAGFSAYKKSDLAVNSDGTYDFSSASPVLISNGSTVLTTDENGLATSDLLDYGTYIVMESVVPTGYEPCDPFEVQIVNHNVTIDAGTKTDTVIPARFRIIKKDSETGQIILKGGAAFKILDVASGTYVNIGGEDTFTTDDTGTVTTAASLPLGTYRIEEVEAPEGYYLNTATVDIVFDSKWPFTMEGTDRIITAEYFNTPKKGRVELTKSGKGLTGYTNDEFVWTDVNLSGAVYEIHADEDIYSPDNQRTLLHAKDDLIGTLTSDASGRAYMDDLYPGKYYLLEITAPAGYVSDTDHINFSISYNDSSTTPIVSPNFISDEKQNIILNLTKTDSETTRPLSGAEFGLYAESDILTFDGTLLFKSGDLIKTAFSDADGIIDFKLDLPYAKYKVKEIKAPVNYVLNTTEFDFTAVFPASDVANVSFSYSWDNKPVRGSLKITKTGETLSSFTNGEFIWESKPLKNAKFNVIAGENIYTSDNAKDKFGRRYCYYKKNQIIEEIETDENGFAKTSNLPIGKYYLVETQAPYGMCLDSTPIDFSIDYKDQYTELVLNEKSILNERQKITLKVTKEENGSLKKLSGGKFDLIADEDILNYEGRVIVSKGEVITYAEANDGVVEFNLDLPHSKYLILEEKAPVDYARNDKTYEIDLNYKDSNMKKLVAELSLFDERLPHFARVSMRLNPILRVRGRNNYITEDYGEDGYSVLLISDGSSLPLSTTLSVSGYMPLALALMFVGCVIVTLFCLRNIIGKNRR